MKKKRIGIFTISLSGGGGERIASVLINQWQDDFDVRVALMNPTIGYPIPETTHITTIGKFKLYAKNYMSLLLLPLHAFTFKKWCLRNELETVICILPRASWIAGFSKIIGNKTRIIIYEVSTPTALYDKKTLAGKLALFLTTKLYAKADKVVGNALGNCDDLEQNLGIKNVSCIYNPIDTGYFKSESLKEPSVEIKKDKFVFFNLSRFQYPKDQLTIIRAFALLQNQDCQLYLSGDGENITAAKELVASYNLQERIIFLGYEKNPFALMRQSDCFVFSSLLEGFPNSLLEALICDIPLISSDCKSGPREIIAPGIGYDQKIVEENSFYTGDVGLLFEVGDAAGLAQAMVQVMENRQLFENLKNAIPAALSRFGEEKTKQQFEELL